MPEAKRNANDCSLTILGRTRELIAMGMNVIVLYCPCPPPRKAQAKVRCITHTGIAALFRFDARQTAAPM